MIEKEADPSREDTGRGPHIAVFAWAPDLPALAVPATWLRPARLDDRDFAAALYLDSMQRLLTPLGKWDEERVMRRFEKSFKVENSRIICHGDTDIGWIQVSQAADRWHLHQIHIVGRYRNRGIGGELIAGLLQRAQAAGQPVLLNVIHGNPAVSLYARFGFRPVRSDAEKILMRWEPGRPAHG